MTDNEPIGQKITTGLNAGADPLDALDPLVPKPEAGPTETGPTDAERAAILAKATEKQQALANLTNAVDAHTKTGAGVDPAVVDAAEDAGHKVNRAHLVAIGALPPPPPEDIDKVPAPAPVEDKPRELGPEPDPGVLVDGKVPIYNPTPGVISFGPYAGDIYSVRAHGIDLVPEGAADVAVGKDNAGGDHSSLGVRRLYGPEPRFAELAKRDGLSLEDWAKRRSLGVIGLADAAYKLVSGEVEQGLADAADKINK